MISDSEQRRMAKDLRVIANGARLPALIFLAALAAVTAPVLFGIALKLCHMFLSTL